MNAGEVTNVLANKGIIVEESSRNKDLIKRIERLKDVQAQHVVQREQMAKYFLTQSERVEELTEVYARKEKLIKVYHYGLRKKMEDAEEWKRKLEESEKEKVEYRREVGKQKRENTRMSVQLKMLGKEKRD